MKTITDINQLDFSKQYTYADHVTWQLKKRVELIKGWLYKMSPAPKWYHQKTKGVMQNFGIILRIKNVKCINLLLTFVLKSIKAQMRK